MEMNPCEAMPLRGLFSGPYASRSRLPHHAYEALVDRSNKQGRSLSNLAAFLLESSLEMVDSKQTRIE